MSNLRLLPSAGAEVPDLRSVPALLRKIADQIDAGHYGIKEAQTQWDEVVCRGALVLRVSGQPPQVFALGDTQAAQAYMDFHAGADELMAMRSPER